MGLRRSSGRSQGRSGRGADDGEAALPEYLRRMGLTPRKALGQHFLIDEFALTSIADACGLHEDSTVFEIGCGPGGLTEELAKRAGRVVAVEIDEELAALARSRLAGHPGVCVIAADILDFTPEELLAECELKPPYVACGNLPYYITQPIVRRLLEAEMPPTHIIVMVQREVARRLVGGEGQESLLSMSVRCYGNAEIVLDLPASAFWPEPKVRSSVIRIERLPDPLVPAANVDRFFNLLRAGFAEPRKQLHNTLRRAFDLSADEITWLLKNAQIDPTLRAQHVGFEDWQRLYDLVEGRHAEVLDVG
jgi:16S rRNA (adenine1518-N6/adenine1519-N6)-dimethyltransferase